MTPAIAAVVALAVIAAIAVTLAWRAFSRRPSETASDWSGAVGEEFAGLPDSARCDLVFAVAAFDDARSLPLLERALEDPCESVALAAAHVLWSRGSRTIVERFFASHGDDRTRRIAGTLALLTETSGATASC